MTCEDGFTEVERRLVDRRAGGELDRVDVEALLEADDPVDRQAGLKGLVLLAAGENDWFEEAIPSLTPFAIASIPLMYALPLSGAHLIGGAVAGFLAHRFG